MEACDLHLDRAGRLTMMETRELDGCHVQSLMSIGTNLVAEKCR